MAGSADAPEEASSRTHVPRHLGWPVVAIGLYAATRIAAVYTVAANWDEFALLDRAATTAGTGILDGGGRPGLASLILVPFVDGCSDEIAALRNARLLWTAVTLAFLIGLGALLGRVCAHSPQRRHDAWLGVGLLALVPAFLEWSVQIRSDQIALACGVWGGVALLASQRRIAWSLAAGLLFGIGYLATQKLVYVGALAVLLAVAQQLRERDLRPRREVLRAAIVAVCIVGVVAAFQFATTTVLDVPMAERALTSLSTPSKIAQQMSEFEFYRNTIGYGQYLEILPTLVPHAVLLAGLLAATIAAVRSRRGDAAALLTAWAVLALGLTIGAFHAAAFAYFYMTLGLFLAAALAIAVPAIRGALPSGRENVARLVTIGVWVMLVVPGIVKIAELMTDTQAVQRESLGFIHRNFDDGAIGFHPERAPFCRREDAPMRQYFSQRIYRHFAGEQRDHNTRYLLSEFRDRPVEFVVQSFRLNQFPVEIRRFMADNYQPYHASVFVAGRQLSGESGDRSEFELIVPGRYRWLPFGDPRRVRIGEIVLGAGETAEFAAGSYTASFVENVAGGMLVLALDELPTAAPLPFYKHY